MSEGHPFRDTCPKCKEKDTEIANLKDSVRYLERWKEEMLEKKKAIPKMVHIVSLVMAAAFFSTIAVTASRWLGWKGAASPSITYAEVLGTCIVTFMLATLCVVLTIQKLMKKFNPND